MDDNSQFAMLSEEEICNLDTEKDSHSTHRTMKRSASLFRDFLGKNNHFESFSKEELNSNLRRFFASVRKQDGSELKRTSLVALKYGINKYLKQYCNIDINSEPLFSGCLNTFKCKMTDLKKKGKGIVKHALVITPEDLQKLNSPDNKAFRINTPEGLQKKVWFDVMFYLLCRKTGENLRSMTKETFRVGVDSSGAKYVYQTADKAEKKYCIGADLEGTLFEARMYERQGDKMCPVKTFEHYISKLHPMSDALWQRPYESFRDWEDKDVWYTHNAVGKNGLATWMSDVSELAGLSHRYTNLSIRSTSTSILDRAGHDIRDIIRATGYKAEDSIRNCSVRLTEQQQRHMSDSLSKALSKPHNEHQPLSGNIELVTDQDLNKQFIDNTLCMETQDEDNGLEPVTTVTLADENNSLKNTIKELIAENAELKRIISEKDKLLAVTVTCGKQQPNDGSYEDSGSGSDCHYISIKPEPNREGYDDSTGGSWVDFNTTIKQEPGEGGYQHNNSGSDINVTILNTCTNFIKEEPS